MRRFSFATSADLDVQGCRDRVNSVLDDWVPTKALWGQAVSSSTMAEEITALEKVAVRKPRWRDPQVCDPRPALALASFGKSGEVQLEESRQIGTFGFIRHTFELHRTRRAERLRGQ
jgi:hypothetical protein